MLKWLKRILRKLLRKMLSNSQINGRGGINLISPLLFVWCYK